MNEKLKTKINELPESPGVYLFYNNKKVLVYVGKATILRDRVRSYFNIRDITRPIEEMFEEVVNIKWITTESVLEAVILEAIYIKKYLPKYNVLGKDDKSWNYLVITNDEYPRVRTMRRHELDVLTTEKPEEMKMIDKIFGPYPGLNTRATMKILRRIFLVSDCEPGQKRPCLYYEMGQCLGVCTGEISAKDYRSKVIKPLVTFLGGHKKQLIKAWEKEMKKAAKEEDFETAARIRNQLSALHRIQDIALLNKNFYSLPLGEFKNGNVPFNHQGNLRIEGYDISNLGTSDKVGGMVVFDRVGPSKSDYRKFKIRTVVGQSDVDCLAEVLERRLKHSEWPLPDILLVDGGAPQVNKAASILRARKINIPIVGIAKGPERKRNDFIVRAGDKEEVLPWIRVNQGLLIRVRDEAHRFAITFNRAQRRIR